MTEAGIFESWDVILPKIFELNRNLGQNYFLKSPELLERESFESAESTEFEGSNIIVDFWREFLGSDYFIGAKDASSLKEGDIVTFRGEVILTEWVPRYPGLFFHKSFWEQFDRTKFDFFIYSDVRLKPRGAYVMMSINSPREEDAHGDISRGIPIFAPVEKIQEFETILTKTGAIKLNHVTTQIREIYIDKELGLKLPLLELIDLSIDDTSKFYPLLGNLWTIYWDKGNFHFIEEHFWVGVPDHKDTLKKAKDRLLEAIPRKSFPLINADQVELELNIKYGPLLVEASYSPWGGLGEDLLMTLGDHPEYELVSFDGLCAEIRAKGKQAFENAFFKGELWNLLKMRPAFSIIDEEYQSSPSGGGKIFEYKFFFYLKTKQSGNEYWGIIKIFFDSNDA